MPREKESTIKLPSLDDLFSSQEERDDARLKRIHEIPLDQIDPFPDHPYKVRDDEEMMALVESVKENGVITPATVRKKEDGRYELLSGHRRMRACMINGISTLRCEVVDMDRDEATIFMVESNIHRNTVLPSEKAFAYKMRLEAMKRQGKRTDLTSAPVVRKFVEARDVIGKEVGESREQVRRFIRLTELIPELLTLVDEKKIAMRPAVEISYLPKDLQGILADCIDMEQCTPSHAQTIRMRKLLDKDELTADAIEEIMLEEKPNQKEKIVLRGERFKGLFPPELPPAKREDYVAAAMEYYSRHRAKQKNRDDAR